MDLKQKLKIIIPAEKTENLNSNLEIDKIKDSAPIGKRGGCKIQITIGAYGSNARIGMTIGTIF